MTMFQAASNAACAKAPGFLVPVRVSMTKAMTSRGHLPILQAIFFGLYSFFLCVRRPPPLRVALNDDGFLPGSGGCFLAATCQSSTRRLP
jgi:hypothetical protein